MCTRHKEKEEGPIGKLRMRLDDVKSVGKFLSTSCEASRLEGDSEAELAYYNATNNVGVLINDAVKAGDDSVTFDDVQSLVESVRDQAVETIKEGREHLGRTYMIIAEILVIKLYTVYNESCLCRPEEEKKEEEGIPEHVKKQLRDILEGLQ